MNFRRLIIGYIAVLLSTFLAINANAKGDKEKACSKAEKCNLKLFIVETPNDTSKCRNPIITTDESGTIGFEVLKIANNFWSNREVNIDIVIPSKQLYTLPKDAVFFTESLSNGDKGNTPINPAKLDINVNNNESKASIKFLRNRLIKTEFYFGVNLEFPGVSDCKVDPKVVNGE